MKFAKELEREAVPEWRIKYLNYKAGKKYVKAVTRAINRANDSPRGLGQQTSSFYYTPSRPNPHTPGKHAKDEQGSSDEDDKNRDGPSNGESSHQSGARSTPPMPVAKKKESDALTRDGNNLQYGSFVLTPPKDGGGSALERTNTFELPAPAIHPTPSLRGQKERVDDGARKTRKDRLPSQRRSNSEGPRPTSQGKGFNPPLLKRGTVGQVTQSPSQLRRLFTHHGGLGTKSKTDIGMSDIDVVRQRELELYDFMDSELEKVESFYKLKEIQAGARLDVLKDQLHEMRNRRIEEIASSPRYDFYSPNGGHHHVPEHDHSSGWVGPIKAKMFPPGPNSKALQNMTATPYMTSMNAGDAERDYIRRPRTHDVSYRTAKHKLKLALQEYYRGLELLKSYALLNRTAFRKLNKKFDKAVNARPTYRYMNDKVKQAWFVRSDVLEGHLKTVEDLYARYFERGNHKLAVGKLRSLTKKRRDQAGSSFQNGFLIGTGLVFSVQALIYAGQLLDHHDVEIRTQTSYLMQIYGGYMLMLILFSLFCINCMIWTRNKVNYPFIFEFDQRHQLDYTRLSEFPSFFFLLLGIFAWVNFSRYGPDYMYLYYPIVLIGLSVIIVFLPLPILAHRSRKWFAYSHWRLLLAGLYPVEFRDFFLGDIYCSLTYAMANLELFFCLYAHDWDNPTQCNSSHSRVMGFLAAVPPIWRFLQCIRRYYDTRNIFPHLVNCGKYTMTIMAAVTLSMYRIHGSRGNFALFITFSFVNSVYCSVWDLFMDFSLLQTDSRHLGLRDILALKKRWPYYAIMVVDPIIRFAWIFYAIFTYDSQHSTFVSFAVGLVEVIRRGMWACFRVENEHCANVSQYKASRDVPLPYHIEPLMDRVSSESSPTFRTGAEPQFPQPGEQQPQQPHLQTPVPTTAEGQLSGSSTAVTSTFGQGVLRRRDTSVWSVSKIMAEAHKQDFEKRRKPTPESTPEEPGNHLMSPSDDDDDDDEDSSVYDISEAEDLRRRGENNTDSRV